MTVDNAEHDPLEPRLHEAFRSIRGMHFDPWAAMARLGARSVNQARGRQRRLVAGLSFVLAATLGAGLFQVFSGSSSGVARVTTASGPPTFRSLAPIGAKGHPTTAARTSDRRPTTTRRNTAQPSTTVRPAMAAPPSSSAPTTTPPTTSPSETTLAPTTTTTVPPSCTNQQFTAEATTDHPTYARGEIVNITVTMSNSGPTCEGVPPWFCGQNASIYNSSHTDVWDWGAGPNQPQDVTGCPAAVSSTIPHGSSSTESMQWHQDQCTFEPSGDMTVPNPDCPQTQVPDGTYTVVADNGRAPSVSIQITG